MHRLAGVGAKVVVADCVRTDATSEKSVNLATAEAESLAPLRISVDTHGGPASGGRLSTRPRRARACARCHARRRVAVQTRALAVQRRHFLAMRPSTILLNSGVPKDTYSARFA